MNFEDSKFSGFYNSKSTAAFFSSIMATIFAGSYWLIHIGFDDNSILPVLKALSISYFLIFLPCACRKVMSSFGLTLGKAWYSSDAAISIWGIFLLTLTGLIIPTFNFLVLLPFVIFGYLFFIINMIDYFFKDNTKNNVIFFFWSILFSILLVFIYFSDICIPPLLLENLVRGHSHDDTFFHCSISQMIKTYGIPSTGLDGIPYTPYHYGSHFIFAYFSKLLGFNVVTFYKLGYIIIFIPFLFNNILSFIIDLKRYFRHPVENWNLKMDYKFWLVFIVAFVGFLPKRILYRLAIRQLIIGSPSNALGLSFFFIIASLLIRYSEKFLGEEKNFKINDLVFFILGLPLLIWIMGLVKISPFILGLVVIGYLFFRLRLYKSNWLIFSSLLIFFISFSNFRLVGPINPDAFSGLVYFNFIKRYVIADKINIPFFWILLIPLFILFHYFWSWLYIVLRTREERIKRVIDIKNAFKENRTIDMEIIMLLCLVGSLPGILMEMKGGVAVYFSELQRWVALTFLLSALSRFSFPDRKWLSRKTKMLILFSLLFIAVGSFLSNAVIAAKDTIGIVIKIRNDIASLPTLSKANHSYRDSFKNIASDRGHFNTIETFKKLVFGPQKSLYESQKYKMYQILQELDKIPVSEKRKTLLFIPKSNKLFWDSLYPYYSVSFIAPALTGIAMIDGLPEKSITSDFPWAKRCFYVYKSRSKNQLLPDASIDKIYSKVLEKGFSKLIIVEYKDENTVITTIP